MIRFDMSAEWPKERLYDFAENIVQRRLERLEDVAQVDVRGMRTPELQVNLDPARMRVWFRDAGAWGGLLFIAAYSCLIMPLK